MPSRPWDRPSGRTLIVSQIQFFVGVFMRALHLWHLRNKNWHNRYRSMCNSVKYKDCFNANNTTHQPLYVRIEYKTTHSLGVCFCIALLSSVGSFKLSLVRASIRAKILDLLFLLLLPLLLLLIFVLMSACLCRSRRAHRVPRTR